MLYNNSSLKKSRKISLLISLICLFIYFTGSSQAFEVDGYTKLGSGEAFPPIKVKRVEMITTSLDAALLPHGLTNGHKISQIFARVALYHAPSDSWEYTSLRIPRWNDEIIIIDQTRITDFGFPKEGHLLKAVIMYEDQGQGVD